MKIGYRKLSVALWWMALLTFAVVMVMMGWAPARAQSLAIVLCWAAGFFSSAFIGGNMVEHWRQGWQIKTDLSLSQQITDTATRKTIETIGDDGHNPMSLGPPSGSK